MKKLFSPLFIFTFTLVFCVFNFLAIGRISSDNYYYNSIRRHPLEVIWVKGFKYPDGEHRMYGFPLKALYVDTGTATSGVGVPFNTPPSPIISWCVKLDLASLFVDIVSTALFAFGLAYIMAIGKNLKPE